MTVGCPGFRIRLRHTVHFLHVTSVYRVGSLAMTQLQQLALSETTFPPSHTHLHLFLFLFVSPLFTIMPLLVVYQMLLARDKYRRDGYLRDTRLTSHVAYLSCIHVRSLTL